MSEAQRNESPLDKLFSSDTVGELEFFAVVALYADTEGLAGDDATTRRLFTRCAGGSCTTALTVSNAAHRWRRCADGWCGHYRSEAG